jgi:hypothetical protein
MGGRGGLGTDCRRPLVVRPTLQQIESIRTTSRVDFASRPDVALMAGSVAETRERRAGDSRCQLLRSYCA